MEKIFEINFFYIGIQEKESKKFDYYDLIKPGVAVLFGENKNYIIYYQINKKTVQSTSFEEISIEEDLLSQITKFFLSKYNLQEVSLVEGLVKCSYEEDEDGLYDYCKEKGGRVFFKNPNTLIDLGANIFLIKQTVEGDFKINKFNLIFDDKILSLKEINSGYFDLNNEQVVYWKKT